MDFNMYENMFFPPRVAIEASKVLGMPTVYLK
jgi:hypothetical protein